MSHEKLDAAAEWFLEIVEPTIDEFLKDTSNKRRGCLAILAVSTMVEHFYEARLDIQEKYKSAEAFRKSIWDVHSKDNSGEGKRAFIAIIHDVANAIKHCERKPSKKESNIPRTNSKDIIRVSPASAGVMRAGWPASSEEEIIIGVDSEWRLAPLLRDTVTFWKEKLEL